MGKTDRSVSGFVFKTKASKVKETTESTSPDLERMDTSATDAGDVSVDIGEAPKSDKLERIKTALKTMESTEKASHANDCAHVNGTPRPYVVVALVRTFPLSCRRISLVSLKKGQKNGFWR